MIGLVGVAVAVRFLDTTEPESRAPASSSIGARGGEMSMGHLATRQASYFFAGTGSAVNVPLTENGATSTVPLSFVGVSSLPE